MRIVPEGLPYNVRTLNPNTNVVEKCTLCFQRHEEEDWVPACVHNCCCGARYFGDLDDPDSSAAKAVAAAARRTATSLTIRTGSNRDDLHLVRRNGGMAGDPVTTDRVSAS